jgi:hypothetical protein
MLAITPRQQQINMRWTEINIRKMFDRLIHQPELVDTSDEIVYEGPFTIVLKYIKTCKENESLCECVQRIVPQFRAYFPPYPDDMLMSFTLESPRHWLEVKQYLEQLTSILVCSCGRLGRNTFDDESEHGKCNNCYIYGFKRGEICSICHEDDGKPWVQTSCNHFFHDMCWSRTLPIHGTKKCPMCRTEQDRHSITKL